VHGDAVGSGFEAGDLADGVHKGLTMMRAGAAHQRSVDVEKNQIGQDSILRYEAAGHENQLQERGADDRFPSSALRRTSGKEATDGDGLLHISH
jgi:hypothetical protein